MNRDLPVRGHLDGELIAALVDGEVGHVCRDSALAHLAHCLPCRAEVDGQRRMKAALGSLSGPQLPADLTARLLSMSSPPPGVASWTPSRPPAAAGRRPAPPTGAAPRPSGRGRIRRSSRRAAGRGATRLRVSVLGAASVFLLGGGAVLVGGSEPAEPPVTPAFETFAEEHAATVTGVPFTSPAVGAAVSVSLQTGPSATAGSAGR